MLCDVEYAFSQLLLKDFQDVHHDCIYASGMKFPALHNIRTLPNFRLWMRFADNTETIVDFSNDITNSMTTNSIMRSLATPEAFARVRIAASGGYIWWDVDVPPTERPDASSDWLYLQSLPPALRQEIETLLEQTTDWNAITQVLNKRNISADDA